MSSEVVEQFQGYFDSVKLFNKIAGNTNDMTDENLAIAVRLIREELLETEQAIEDYNEVEIIDGVCDVMVTSYGLMRLFPIFEEMVFESLDYPIGVTPMSAVQSIKHLLDVKEYGRAIFYAHMLFMACDKFKRWNMHENMLEVLDTNLKKYPSEERVTAESVLMYEARGVEATYECVDGVYVIRRDDGKILKPIGWKAPNIVLG